MALEHAILVALTEKSSTGYDLARRFDKSIGQFWTATHQQVYKVLARMEKSGWVGHTVVAQEGRPDKKVYAVTTAGRAELADWIALPAEPESTRSDLAVKIRGASDGDLASVLAEVARHRALHADRLDAYLANEKHEFPNPAALTGRALHQWLVLRGGITLEQSLIDWYDQVIGALGAARHNHSVGSESQVIGTLGAARHNHSVGSESQVIGTLGAERPRLKKGNS